jgi:hypothetical protein
MARYSPPGRSGRSEAVGTLRTGNDRPEGWHFSHWNDLRMGETDNLIPELRADRMMT